MSLKLACDGNNLTLAPSVLLFLQVDRHIVVHVLLIELGMLCCILYMARL